MCPACGRPTRVGARFCEECGAALNRRCPSCRSEVGASARFCASCGRHLEAPPVVPAVTAPADAGSSAPTHSAEQSVRDRAVLEGERRTVTVLFVDAVGSTGLAERLGEEEMYALMQRCLARMTETVHGFD